MTIGKISPPNVFQRPLFAHRPRFGSEPTVWDTFRALEYRPQLSCDGVPRKLEQYYTLSFPQNAQIFHWFGTLKTPNFLNALKLIAPDPTKNEQSIQVISPRNSDTPHSHVDNYSWADYPKNLLRITHRDNETAFKTLNIHQEMIINLETGEYESKSTDTRNPNWTHVNYCDFANPLEDLYFVTRELKMRLSYPESTPDYPDKIRITTSDGQIKEMDYGQNNRRISDIFEQLTQADEAGNKAIIEMDQKVSRMNQVA